MFFDILTHRGDEARHVLRGKESLIESPEGLPRSTWAQDISPEVESRECGDDHPGYKSHGIPTRCPAHLPRRSLGVGGAARLEWARLHGFFTSWLSMVFTQKQTDPNPPNSTLFKPIQG